MKRKLIGGYLYYKFIDCIKDEDLHKLTHLYVSFAHIIDGKLTITHINDLKNKVNHFKTVNPKLKVIISVGGMNAEGFSDAAYTDRNRKIFAKSVLELLVGYSFDGVDLDWEYPNGNNLKIKTRYEDTENFTLLIKELRTVLQEKYIISVTALADKDYVKKVELDQIKQYINYFQIMTYDMNTANITAHHTALYSDSNKTIYSVDSAVNDFKSNGIPPEMIAIGCAFYSRKWLNVPDDNNGLYASVNEPSVYGGDYTAIESMVKTNQNNRYWDDISKVPYLYHENTFYSYDDVESICEKAKFVKANELLGLFFWEYTGDKSGQLIKTLNLKLTDEQ